MFVNYLFRMFWRCTVQKKKNGKIVDLIDTKLALEWETPTHARLSSRQASSYGERPEPMKRLSECKHELDEVCKWSILTSSVEIIVRNVNKIIRNI